MQNAPCAWPKPGCGPARSAAASKPDDRIDLRIGSLHSRSFLPQRQRRSCSIVPLAHSIGSGACPGKVVNGFPIRTCAMERLYGCPNGPRRSRSETIMSKGEIIDISLELDARNFAMRTPVGFKKDMQFEMEVLKEHDAPGGAGQIVRGVHMRLHAGSHVDAPEHNVRGGTQIHQLPLELFIGDAIVADLRDKMPSQAITEADLERPIGG